MKILEPEFNHSDARRSITQLFTHEFKQVNVYEAKQGAVLGNHFHKQTIEFFYIISGTIDYNLEKLVEEGEIFVVYPEERHTITCVTDVKLMTFLTKPYSHQEPDIHK